MNIIKQLKLRNQLRKSQTSVLDEPLLSDALASSTAQIAAPQHEINHFHYLNPSDSQGHLPSCSGHALCNLIEYYIRRSGKYVDILPKRWQLNGRRVWQESLKHTGRKNTGLTFNELLLGARGGILPPDFSGFRHINTREAMSELEKKPLLTAIKVNTAWTHADRRTGMVPDNGSFKELHAVLTAGCSFVDIEKYPDGPYMHIMNSWGVRNGVDGIITLDWFRYKTALAYIYDVVLPPDYIDSKRWVPYIINA
jgi:hypothetical protein